MNANKENLDELTYKYMNISIKGTQLQYFESLYLWQKYERDSQRTSLAGDDIFNGLNKSVFNVIEELEMHFRFGKLKDAVAFTTERDQSSKFIVEGHVSDIRINMTSERYNSLINVNKMIEISSRDFTSKILLHEKEDILGMAAHTGYLRKRGETLQYWNKQYGVLSGSYLYFYPEEYEEAESYDSWMYIKDAVVEVHHEIEEKLDNVFSVSNLSQTILMYVQDEESMREWIKLLRERIYEIGNIAEHFDNEGTIENSQSLDPLKQVDISTLPEIKIFDINLELENVEYNMINDDFSRFLNLKIAGMTLNSEMTTIGYRSDKNGKMMSVDNKYSHYIDLVVKKVKINDVANDLVLLESFNEISIHVNVLHKNSKMYKGDNIVLNLEFDIVNVNFLPKTVKKMITFLRRAEFEGSEPVKNNENHRLSTIIEESKEESFTSTPLFNSQLNQLHTKRFDKTPVESDIGKSDIRGDRRMSYFDVDNYNNILTGKSIMKIHMSLKRTLISLINPAQMKPFVYLEANQMHPFYELKQGYHTLNLECEDMMIRAESPVFGVFDVVRFNTSGKKNKVTNVRDKNLPLDLK